MTFAEGIQEVGRQGSIRAKRVLQQLLGESVDLPFNAYDNTSHLEFIDRREFGGADGRFCFDLGGALKRKNVDKFDHQEAVEVLVEVKADYREFLRRAAIASTEARYASAWFIFYSTVPFGSNQGVQLVDGTLLRECAKNWPEPLRASVNNLPARIALVIATDSFVTLLTTWVPDAT
jgi:hypothetical protein